MRSRPFTRATRRLVVGYLLTMGKGSEDARTWAFSGLLALAVFEYQARLECFRARACASRAILPSSARLIAQCARRSHPLHFPRIPPFPAQTRILSVDYLTPLFPRSTVNEKLELLHKLFPPFLHGSRMISQVISRDLARSRA